MDCDLVFNLAESFAGNDTADACIAAYLELLGKRFTGAGSHGLLYAQDKAVAKKILEFHGIHTPVFARSYRGRLDFSHDLEFPVIVKPAREDGSIGIEFNAVVNSIRELMERIDWLHANFDSPVLIEEYVEGREMYVGVLGNENPTALPVVELDLSKLPEGTPRIAGAEVKWGKGTAAYRDTKSAVAENLPEDDRGAAPADRRGGLPGARIARLRPYRHAVAAGRPRRGHRGESQPWLPRRPSSRWRRGRPGGPTPSSSGKSSSSRSRATARRPNSGIRPQLVSLPEFSTGSPRAVRRDAPPVLPRRQSGRNVQKTPIFGRFSLPGDASFGYTEGTAHRAFSFPNHLTLWGTCDIPDW